MARQRQAWMVGLLLLGASCSGADSGEPPVVPGPEEISVMSDAERKTRLEALVRVSESSPPVKEEMPGGGNEPFKLRQGLFEPRLYPTSGEATLYQLPDGNTVVRLTGLDVQPGPALRVILTVHPNPSRGIELSDGIADLGALKATSGDQNYPVPAGTNVSLFQSVAIYCEPFRVVFGSALLDPVLEDDGV